MVLGHKCAAASGVGDGRCDNDKESRTPAIGLQELVANHRKRLWSKALVVSVAEKVPVGIRYEPLKANNRELPFNCRNCSDDVETGR